jgi:hypothetical protein
MVRLFISRIYEPSFWFRADELEVDNGPQVLQIPCDRLESLIGGRARNFNPAADYSLITYGIMRSWLLAKLRVMPGPLEESVKNISYSEVCLIFTDPSDVILWRWAARNDMRAKRATVTDTEEQVGKLSVRRNKLI